MGDKHEVDPIELTIMKCVADVVLGSIKQEIKYAACVPIVEGETRDITNFS